MGGQRKCSPATTALLVLFACNLAVLLSKLPPPLDTDGNGAGVEPVGYVASKLFAVLSAYASAWAAHRGRGRGLSLETLLGEVQRTWRRPVTTALYIELLVTAVASLLLMLRAFLGASSGAGAGLLAASVSMALVGWLGPVLFAHSDIACRMSLIVAVAEDGYEGSAAVERAEALVRGHRTRGVAVAMAATMVEQAPAWWWGDGAPFVVVGPAVLAAKLVACYACAAFYFECRRRHAIKFEEMATCRDMDRGGGSSLVHEAETEEMGGAFSFERLRLT